MLPNFFVFSSVMISALSVRFFTTEATTPKLVSCESPKRHRKSQAYQTRVCSNEKGVQGNVKKFCEARGLL